MSKTVTVYFSVGGATANAAAAVAEACGADRYSLLPEIPYTAADLDYNNPASRCSVEMQDLRSRPALAESPDSLKDYDTILLGFPVWWGREPSIIDTFLDSLNLSGKTILPFCTSAMSGIDDACARIRTLVSGKACVKAGLRITSNTTPAEILTWYQA